MWNYQKPIIPEGKKEEKRCREKLCLVQVKFEQIVQLECSGMVGEKKKFALFASDDELAGP